MAFLRGPINFINDQLYNTCSRPFYIYVQTAVPAFFDAWLMLRIVDFNDLVRARGSYIAGKGLWGTGRGKRHGIGRRGKGVPQNKEKYAAQGLKHLIQFTQPLEYLGLALLMYGAVDNFYRDWQWYLDLADACIEPDFYQPEIRKVTDGQCFPNAGGNSVQLPDLVGDNPSISSNAIGCSMPAGRAKAIFAVTFRGPANGGGTWAIGLRATGVIGSGDFRSEAIFVQEGTEVDLIVDADLFYPSPTGGQLHWLVYGPGVPVGLQVPKARVIIQRQATALG